MPVLLQGWVTSKANTFGVRTQHPHGSDTISESLCSSRHSLDLNTSNLSWRSKRQRYCFKYMSESGPAEFLPFVNVICHKKEGPAGTSGMRGLRRSLPFSPVLPSDHLLFILNFQLRCHFGSGNICMACGFLTDDKRLARSG